MLSFTENCLILSNCTPLDFNRHVDGQFGEVLLLQGPDAKEPGRLVSGHRSGISHRQGYEAVSASNTNQVGMAPFLDYG